MDSPAPPDPAKTDDHPHSLGAILGRIRAAAGPDDTEVRAMVEAMGPASFTPVLLLPALIVVSPLSGIFGLPSVCGLAIAAIALQRLFGRTHLWLPRWLLSRHVSSARLMSALDWLKRPAGWFDRVTAQRLTVLTVPPASWLLLLACALAGAAMPLLEILPLTSSILAGAIAMMALGLMVRDGLVALAGLGWLSVGVGAIVWLVM